jgi:predicted ATPase
MQGQTESGRQTLSEALEQVDRTGERWWAAELYRVEGELMLGQPAPDEQQAEACFHRSLSIARHQQAKSLELRTTTSLARLWQSQGKRQEAVDLLAPVYDWFTEGFDTTDLQDAKGLLEALASL